MRIDIMTLFPGLIDGVMRESIIGRAQCQCERCEEFTPIGEGDHICGADPHRMPVSDYMPTEDYYWCKGAHFVEG